MGRKRRSKSLLDRNSATSEEPKNSKSLPLLRVKISRISLACRHGNVQQAVDNVENDFGSVAVGCGCAKVVPQQRLREDNDCGRANRESCDGSRRENEDCRPAEVSNSDSSCEKGVAQRHRHQVDDGKSFTLTVINEASRKCDNERRDSGRPLRSVVDVKPDSKAQLDQPQEEENDR